MLTLFFVFLFSLYAFGNAVQVRLVCCLPHDRFMVGCHAYLLHSNFWLHSAFDELAKELGVFKVETVSLKVLLCVDWI